MVAIEPRSGSDELGDAVQVVLEPAVDTVRAGPWETAARPVLDYVKPEAISLHPTG